MQWHNTDFDSQAHGSIGGSSQDTSSGYRVKHLDYERTPSPPKWQLQYVYPMTMMLLKQSFWDSREVQEPIWSLTLKLTVFSLSMGVTFPNLCDLDFRHLLPLASTERCEAELSNILHSKTKFRNKLQGGAWPLMCPRSNKTQNQEACRCHVHHHPFQLVFTKKQHFFVQPLCIYVYIFWN